MAYTFRLKCKETEEVLKQRLSEYDFKKSDDEEESVDDNKEKSQNTNEPQIKLESNASDQQENIQFVSISGENAMYKCADCGGLFVDKTELEAHVCSGLYSDDYYQDMDVNEADVENAGKFVSQS